MVIGIVNNSKPAWYCKKCRVGHNVLYKDGKESYCENCVPKEVKSKAKYMNHNREEVEFIE